MDEIELRWWKGMTTFKESITTDDDLMAPIGLQGAMDDLLPPSTHVQDMATAYEAADNQEDKEKAEDGNATDDVYRGRLLHQRDSSTMVTRSRRSCSCRGRKPSRSGRRS